MNATLNPVIKKRLIVLIPDSLSDNLEMANKLYWMAIQHQCDVMYLALVDNSESMISVSHNMAILNAVTASNCLVVHSKLTETNLWLRTLREIYQPGDIIVCHEEQSVKSGFLRTMPIGDFLQVEFDARILTMSGFYHPEKMQIKHWVNALIAWLGFIIILAGCTMLEIGLDQQLQGLTRNLMMIVVVILELGAILIWDNVASQGRRRPEQRWRSLKLMALWVLPWWPWRHHVHSQGAICFCIYLLFEGFYHYENTKYFGHRGFRTSDKACFEKDMARMADW